MMAWMSGLITLAFAGFICPLLLIIFRYTMKEKTYDERMAEQRKKLMEHNMKSKSKQQPAKKSAKKADKDRSHPEKKNKVVSQSSSGKENKKSEVSKSNVLTSTDRVDGTSVPSKKKSDKAYSKSTNSNPNFKSVADDNDEKQRAVNDDNNNPEKNAISSENDDSSSNAEPITSNGSSNGTDIDVSSSSFSSHPENGGVDNSCYSGSSNESEGGSINEKISGKNKSLSQNSILQSEASDEVEKKSTTELPEKSKKQNSKHENDVSGKAYQKAEEKTRYVMSPKQKTEDKDKVDGEKFSKDGKLLASPAKNKKSSEKNSETGSDSGLCVVEDAKNMQDVKKEIEISVIVSEPVVEKNECNLKVEKSPSPVTRKPNVSVATGNSGGKTSPVQGAKNQRQSNNVKNAKKQTTEMKTLQKITNETNGPVNVTLLIPLLAKAELSRSEIQNLIDLLLNKQQENRTIDAEWIGSGRQDPMVKLKKQLAEKEKALTAEQEAHQAIQNKLKELRIELNNEKHANRQREETLNSRQSDMQALNARLQAISDEKQNLMKQIQQLQSKLNEERLISRSLKEENSKTKNNLQQELLSQRQQLEMHIAHMSEQHQQTVMALEAQLGQVAARIQEQESTNGQMTDEIVLLRERITVLDNQIAHYQQTHPATQDLMMQLEDLRNVRTILERDLNSSQFEVNRLNGELRSITEQLNRKNAEIDKFNCIVNNVKIENEELLKENSRNNEQINLAYNEKAQLQIECDEFKKQLMELRDKSNSSEQLQELESTAYQYQTMYNEKVQELYQLQERLAQLEASTKDTQLRDAELEEKKKYIDLLDSKLSKQLEKNDELRRKNWKAIEALASMERALESKMKRMPCSSHDIKLKEREKIAKQIVKKLPNIRESKIKMPPSYEDDEWFKYLEKVFSDLSISQPTDREPQFSSSVEESTVPKDNNVPVLDELEKQNKQLQNMVSRYKHILSETEGTLNSLQNHIEQEENRWSEQVRILSDQVQTMNEKMQVLESQMNVLAEERNCLLDKVKNIQNGCIENDIANGEQKVNSLMNKCVPLVANSSISDAVSEY